MHPRGAESDVCRRIDANDTDLEALPRTCALEGCHGMCLGGFVVRYIVTYTHVHVIATYGITENGDSLVRIGRQLAGNGNDPL